MPIETQCQLKLNVNQNLMLIETQGRLKLSFFSSYYSVEMCIISAIINSAAQFSIKTEVGRDAMWERWGRKREVYSIPAAWTI